MREYKTEAEVASDALGVQGGAVNPIAVAGVLHQAIKFYALGKGSDSARCAPVRLILHQLQFILRCGEFYLEGGHNHSYAKDLAECETLAGKLLHPKAEA
jgi:hypothetical protein